MIGGRTGMPRLPSTGPGSPITTARAGAPRATAARSASNRASMMSSTGCGPSRTSRSTCSWATHRLAQVEHREVGAAGAHVGEQHVPAARGERQPVGGPTTPGVGRVPAIRTTPRSSSSSTAALTVVRAMPGGGHEVRLALRRPGRDQPRQRC